VENRKSVLERWSMDAYMKYLAELITEKDSLKLVKNEAEKYA
jgi:hypothetical protein